MGKDKGMTFFKQLVLVLGIFCIIWGLLFIYLAFNKERLSDGNKIGEVTEYIADKPKLSVGEVKVTKSTEYLKDATYRLVYKNYMNNDNNTEVLDSSSDLQIVDVLGTGYEIEKDVIKVNDKNYNSNDDIQVVLENQMIKINIPHDLCSKINTIEFKIKLKENTEGVKYFTSQDAYYNFVPSENNKFYEKKTPQSYLIDGNGYIKLINDKEK